MDVDGGLERLRSWPMRDLGHTRLDTHREHRCGAAEVVYGEGKTREQVLEIARALLEHSPRVLVTRLASDAAAFVQREIPDASYHAVSRTLAIEREPVRESPGLVIVACAGTSDLPVAEEAAVSARFHGAKVELLRDVGVAGLHRLLAHTAELQSARAIVAVAGMEGALPSVVAGLVAVPVIAVPTSVGYGASFGGLAALLAMLNSCAAGVAVVNIDNGYGAGALAARINTSHAEVSRR
jgi:NCAIR mutase (PurE)-related protein